MNRTEALAQTFVELADTLVSDFDAVEFLHVLTLRCVQLLDVDAAGVMLVDKQGILHVVAASDEKTRLLELMELQQQEGPCVEAYRNKELVWASLDAGATRWPRFSEHAKRAGYRALGAVPLRLREQSIGALNLFCTEDRPLAGTALATAQALADVASIGLLQERAVRESHVIAQQLQSALDSRVAIEQAKGMVAQSFGIDIDAAFTVIRTFARNHNLKLTEVVRELTQRRLPVNRLR